MHVIVEGQSGTRRTITLEGFNRLLDWADDDPQLEPLRWWWVWSDEIDFYCRRHGWPAAVCWEWLHGPGTNAFGQVVTSAELRAVWRSLDRGDAT